MGISIEPDEKHDKYEDRFNIIPTTSVESGSEGSNLLMNLKNNLLSSTRRS